MAGDGQHRARDSARLSTTTLLAWLLRPVDSAWLAAFRVALGSLVFVSVLRYALYDRIDALFVRPQFHFKYWGLGWVHPLPQQGMHSLIWALAGLSLCVVVGLGFRAACVALACGFGYLQLIDVATYLNHYYLVTLMLLLLAASPAGSRWSLDRWLAGARRGPACDAPAELAVSAAWLYLFRFQLAVVYTFAGLAKAHGDWLVHAQPLRIWLAARTDLPLLGAFFVWPPAPLLMSWAGFLFDTAIAWLLLAKATRPLAYCMVVAFHALTYVLFPMIGMFPLVMVTCALVFFSPSWPAALLARVRKRLGRSRSVESEAPSAAAPRQPLAASRARRLALALGGLYCLLQLLLPLRYLVYGGNVLWHEQGMRFSWRVMVREKGASVTFVVRSKASGRSWQVGPDHYLTALQEREMSEQPDLILQLAHHIRDDFAKRGHGPVEVRADARVSLNGRPSRPFIDPQVDLAAIEDGVKPATFILPSPSDPPPHNRAI
jgi:vitamin K-dependent gamma-carboxylase